MKTPFAATALLLLASLYVTLASPEELPSLRQFDEQSQDLEVAPDFPVDEVPVEVEFIGLDGEGDRSNNLTCWSQGVRDDRARVTRFRQRLEFAAIGKITARFRFPAKDSLSGVIRNYKGVVTWIRPSGKGSIKLTAGGVGYKYAMVTFSHPRAKGFSYDFIFYW